MWSLEPEIGANPTERISSPTNHYGESMSSNSAAGLGIVEAGGGTEEIQAKDNKFVHPWENLKSIGQNKRPVLTRGDGNLRLRQ